MLYDPRTFGDRDKMIRENKPFFRMLPADQRFKPGNAALRQVQDRLQVREKLPLLQRRTQLLLHFHFFQRQITLLFLLQALALGLLGVLLGNLIGTAGVAWLANYGIPIGDMGAVAADIPISAVLQARFNPSGMLWLSLWTLLITLVASLYPAWYASRLEPVDALNAL